MKYSKIKAILLQAQVFFEFENPYFQTYGVETEECPRWPIKAWYQEAPEQCAGEFYTILEELNLEVNDELLHKVCSRMANR